MLTLGCSSNQPITIAKLASGTTVVGVLKNNQKPNIISSDFQINASSLRKDTLFLDVQYGGGCNIHEFHAYIKEDNKESVTLDIIHKNNGDACRALITEQIWLDLSTLQKRKTSPIQIVIHGTDKVFEYKY